MTYPPQQPGPGGWEPRGDEQQQPAWYGNQHASWEQGPAPEPPPGRPLQPGQQGAPSQAGQPGSPGGQPGPQGGQPGQQTPPPPDWTGAGFAHQARPYDAFGAEDLAPTERRSWRPWALGGLAVALIAAAGVVVWLLFFSGPGSPRPAAQALVDEVNAGNLDALSNDLCTADRAKLATQLDQLDRAEFDIRLGQVATDGDSATARLVGTYSVGGASKPVDQTIRLIVENGDWKVCDLQA